jgi:MFS family permease
VGLV